jgi:ABC-type branched-subunit amino acid transport system ATPase component
MTPILQLQSVSRYFGGLAALLDVSFEINKSGISILLVEQDVMIAFELA